MQVGSFLFRVVCLCEKFARMLSGGDSNKHRKQLISSMSEAKDDDRWSQLAAELGALDAKPAPVLDEPVGDEPPKRRRRRRSRRTSADAVGAADPTFESTVGAEAGSEAPADDSAAPKRRRRRGPKTKAALADAANGERFDVSQDDGGDEPVEPMSIANLPSWQQLIDNLYRP